jgi:hypothetical protein
LVVQGSVAIRSMGLVQGMWRGDLWDLCRECGEAIHGTCDRGLSVVLHREVFSFWWDKPATPPREELRAVRAVCSLQLSAEHVGYIELPFHLAKMSGMRKK